LSAEKRLAIRVGSESPKAGLKRAGEGGHERGAFVAMVRKIPPVRSKEKANEGRRLSDKLEMAKETLNLFW